MEVKVIYQGKTEVLDIDPKELLDPREFGIQESVRLEEFLGAAGTEEVLNGRGQPSLKLMQILFYVKLASRFPQLSIADFDFKLGALMNALDEEFLAELAQLSDTGPAVEGSATD